MTSTLDAGGRGDDRIGSTHVISPSEYQMDLSLFLFLTLSLSLSLNILTIHLFLPGRCDKKKETIFTLPFTYTFEWQEPCHSRDHLSSSLTLENKRKHEATTTTKLFILSSSEASLHERPGGVWSWWFKF